MKRLFTLCIAILLLLSACAKAPGTPTEPSSSTEPLSTTELTSEEASSTTEPPATTIAWNTQFTVTEHKLPPPKQAFPAEFEAFYKQFTDAVRDRNMSFIDSILDEGVMSSFGGEPGKAYFHEYWGYEQNNLWAVLDAIVALGGVYYPEKSERYPSYGNCFVAPYTYTGEFEGLDGFDYFVVIDKGVPVYTEESTESEVVTTLDYRILEFRHSDDFWPKGPDDFVSVTTLAGPAGYIQKKYLRSPIDYRLCIEQKDGGWKLLWLIAGD